MSTSVPTTPTTGSNPVMGSTSGTVVVVVSAGTNVGSGTRWQITVPSDSVVVSQSILHLRQMLRPLVVPGRAGTEPPPFRPVGLSRHLTLPGR